MPRTATLLPGCVLGIALWLGYFWFETVALARFLGIQPQWSWIFEDLMQRPNQWWALVGWLAWGMVMVWPFTRPQKTRGQKALAQQS